MKLGHNYPQSRDQADSGVLAKPFRIVLDRLNVISIIRARSDIDGSCLSFEFFLRSFVRWREDTRRVFEKVMYMLVVEEIDNSGAGLTLTGSV